MSLKEQLLEINGIGEKLAESLAKKINKLSDLKEPAIYNTLPHNVQMYVTYKPLNNMPYQTAHKFISTKLKPLLDKHKLNYEFAGSYRRHKLIMRDIDLLLVDANYESIDKVLSQFGQVILLRGPQKSAALIMIAHNKYAKIDIYLCKKEDKPAFLLYLTGSKDFNIQMRAIAKRHKYLLNQFGLFKGNKKIKTSSELDFFKILNIDYVDPINR